MVSALSERESSALWELKWVRVTGTTPKMPVGLAFVPVTGDWTLVFLGHLERANGKASAPHHLQASETHLLTCALQPLFIICCPLFCAEPAGVQLHPSVPSPSAVACLLQSLDGSSTVISQILLRMLLSITREAWPVLATERGISAHLIPGTAQ